MDTAPPHGPAPGRAGAAPPALDPDAAIGALLSVGRRASAAELAFASLREAVISLALPPGLVLSRPAIAARLGVSQTPVREALIRLQEEGLVEIVPHSATRVSRIDVAQAAETHFLRLSVELEIVGRLAAAPTPALAASLRAEIARMAELLRQGDAAGVSAADHAFHAVLYAAAEVPGLRDLVRQRSGHLDRLRRLHLPTPGKAAQVLQDHEALAAAIIGGDPDAAGQLLRRHLSGTFGELARIQAAHPGYF